MPNKPRPDCPGCEEDGETATAMEPMYIKRPRGETYKRAGPTFYCDDHNIVAVGRQMPTYLAAVEDRPIVNDPCQLGVEP